MGAMTGSGSGFLDRPIPALRPRFYERSSLMGLNGRTQVLDTESKSRRPVVHPIYGSGSSVTTCYLIWAKYRVRKTKEDDREPARLVSVILLDRVGGDHADWKQDYGEKVFVEKKVFVDRGGQTWSSSSSEV